MGFPTCEHLWSYKRWGSLPFRSATVRIPNSHKSRAILGPTEGIVCSSFNTLCFILATIHHSQFTIHDDASLL